MILSIHLLLPYNGKKVVAVHSQRDPNQSKGGIVRLMMNCRAVCFQHSRTVSKGRVQNKLQEDVTRCDSGEQSDVFLIASRQQ